MSSNDQDLLGQSGSNSDKLDEKDERDRTNETRDQLRDAIRDRGGKPKL